ncbi:hypothetical protein D3C83_152150 [compost metagenome]
MALAKGDSGCKERARNRADRAEKAEADSKQTRDVLESEPTFEHRWPRDETDRNERTRADHRP